MDRSHMTTRFRLFQDYAGLPKTGRLDDKTVKRMMQPRCGQRDLTSRSGRAVTEQETRV